MRASLILSRFVRPNQLPCLNSCNQRMEDPHGRVVFEHDKCHPHLNSVHTMCRANARQMYNNNERDSNKVPVVQAPGARRLNYTTSPQVDMERQSVVGSCATALVVICKEVGPQEDKVHAVIQRLPHYYAALLKYLGASLSYVDLGSQSAKAENVLNYHFELLGSLHGITSVCFAAGLQAMLGRYVEELMRCVTHKHLLESPHPPVVDEARRLVLLLGDDMPWAQLQDALLNTLESTEYETHDHQVSPYPFDTLNPPPDYK